ncbi:hypothetical protein CYLTODRAFT_427765 [Cylindrobasidium torrendii FP15055 ss-10]|uniref:Uncharacterized protein n=1 Tax=Cylindrobasidium torrendii FP15055 ss-10 TaxID=1314674 RepID=A0A0D7ASM8_9AGAR|nr:hypothetical protein CYLTODRAFT_427765 [Cylindrobasidium torrendii FP15055 ss-10]
MVHPDESLPVVRAGPRPALVSHRRPAPLFLEAESHPLISILTLPMVLSPLALRYDTMQYISAPASVASMGLFLLAAGEKGKRHALPNSG